MLSQQVEPANQNTRQQFEPRVTHYLNLRIHHLSSFFIRLLCVESDPAEIEIRCEMINYMNTPNYVCDNPALAKAFVANNIKLHKYDFDVPSITPEILTKKCSEFHFNGKKYSHELLVSDENTRRFDEVFNSLKDNIEVILKVNKEIKRLKKIKKTNRTMISKQSYKQELKRLEATRSNAKKNIRETIIGLYK